MYKKLFEKYSVDDMHSSLINKYILPYKYKLKDEILISRNFEIKIRNINQIELDVIKQVLLRRILDIFEVFDEFVVNDEKDLKLMKERFFDKFDKDYPEYIFLDLDHYQERTIIEKIFVIMHENITCFNASFNKYEIAGSIVDNYFSDCLIVYSSNEKSIYDFISKCENLSQEEIDDYDKYDEFIFKYFDLWNLINFGQEEHLGVKLMILRTSIQDLLNLYPLYPDSTLSKYMIEVKNVFNDPISIDFDFQQLYQEELFWFIVKRFNDYYVDDINKFLLYVSIIELLITHKQNPKNENDTIKKQFGTKIVECYNRVGKKIGLSEIGHIYDYRSDLLHGNFKEAKKDLNKLKKEEYFINMFNNFYSENVDFSNADALDILRIRTREILSIIYKLHCTDFTFIKELKKKIID